MNNDKASRAWQASKNKGTTRVRPTLDRVQRIEFLELLAQMSSRSVFERKLGLLGSDIEFYKRELDVESPDEARRKANQMKRMGEDEREAQVLERTQQVREAEQVAQARLEALETKRAAEAAEKPRKKVDVNRIRQEDADRQRRFAESQSGIEAPTKEWRLKIEEGDGSEEDQKDRFRRSLVYHGLTFTAKKYGATTQQVKFEAARLGLKINWDIVRR